MNLPVELNGQHYQFLFGRIFNLETLYKEISLETFKVFIK